MIENRYKARNGKKCRWTDTCLMDVVNLPYNYFNSGFIIVWICHLLVYFTLVNFSACNCTLLHLFTKKEMLEFVLCKYCFLVVKIYIQRKSLTTHDFFIQNKVTVSPLSNFIEFYSAIQYYMFGKLCSKGMIF